VSVLRRDAELLQRKRADLVGAAEYPFPGYQAGADFAADDLLGQFDGDGKLAHGEARYWRSRRCGDAHDPADNRLDAYQV
jgi:hypothetical protein